MAIDAYMYFQGYDRQIPVVGIAGQRRQGEPDRFPLEEVWVRQGLRRNSRQRRAVRGRGLQLRRGTDAQHRQREQRRRGGQDHPQRIHHHPQDRQVLANLLRHVLLRHPVQAGGTRGPQIRRRLRHRLHVPRVLLQAGGREDDLLGLRRRVAKGDGRVRIRRADRPICPAKAGRKHGQHRLRRGLEPRAERRRPKQDPPIV